MAIIHMRATVRFSNILKRVKNFSDAPPVTQPTVLMHRKKVAVLLSGNIVGRINEVTLRQAGLVLRRVAIREYTILAFNKATQANSAFHPAWIGKSSTGLLGWGKGGVHSSVSGGR